MQGVSVMAAAGQSAAVLHSRQQPIVLRTQRTIRSAIHPSACSRGIVGLHALHSVPMFGGG